MYTPVQFVKTEFINLQHGKSAAGDLPGDGPISFDYGKIPHTPQQAVHNPWCPAAPLCDLMSTFSCYWNFQNGSASRYDLHQFFKSIQIEPGDNAEPVPERSSKKALFCRCPDKSELFKIQFNRTCTWAFPDHPVSYTHLTLPTNREV